VGAVDVKFLAMDLSDFRSVKNAAKTVLSEAKRLDVLMLNAGIVCCLPLLLLLRYVLIRVI
jgi:retinol dehydrogenase-12